MGTYRSFIAGLKYPGDDGFNRARWCAQHLTIGDVLLFEPEPNNRFDSNAVQIRPASDPSLVLGYVPREHEWICEAIREGHSIDSVVSDIQCDGAEPSAWRVWTKVRVGEVARAAHQAVG